MWWVYGIQLRILLYLDNQANLCSQHIVLVFVLSSFTDAGLYSSLHHLSLWFFGIWSVSMIFFTSSHIWLNFYESGSGCPGSQGDNMCHLNILKWPEVDSTANADSNQTSTIRKICAGVEVNNVPPWIMSPQTLLTSESPRHYSPVNNVLSSEQCPPSSMCFPGGLHGLAFLFDKFRALQLAARNMHGPDNSSVTHATIQGEIQLARIRSSLAWPDPLWD